jgi:hypothetical protein
LEGRKFIRRHGDFLLLFVGFCQLYFLWKYGRILEEEWRIKKPLIIAAFFFVIMFSIDILAPKNLFLRLSFEDLSKTWANLFFLYYAFQYYLRMVNRMKASNNISQSNNILQKVTS